jgi:hypothetical protein
MHRSKIFSRRIVSDSRGSGQCCWWLCVFSWPPCFCKYCLLGDYERCLNKAIIGGWEKRKVNQKAVQRTEPTNLTKVQQFFSKSYNYNHHAYGIIIAVIETNKPIDDDPEAEETVNLEFFVLKSSLEKRTNALTIDENPIRNATDTRFVCC